MSSLTVEEEQKWVPTHVQVTVLRGRGLRGKGKHGTSDVYTIIQLGKEKYSTCVAEKTTEPEWKEECTFELQPGVLESGSPAGSNELVLTVMHRALMGLDVFLGQAVIKLDNVYRESRGVKNEWYRLNSKTGKKEKERGDVQVTVQFTRNNLTASMYDLVMKEKGTSTFGKLKERMRAKRRSSGEDSSSAILPGGYGSLCRMRHRLPSDGGGEEDYEDDEGGEVRRSKMRTFFHRGKLRKSSDTRSSTSLGSESSESSSRGGSLSPTAGISVVVSDLSNSPSNSSNLTADNSPEHTSNMSPKSLSSLKCEFGDEAGEITIAVPQPTVCVNGSHAYSVQPRDPGSGKPLDSLGLGLLQKSLPLSLSLQNLSPQASTGLPKGLVGDGRRWSFDKPGEEEKAAIAAALEQSGPMVADEDDQRLGQAPPTKAPSSPSQGKKQRRNFFSPGRSESAGKGQSQSKDESEQAPAATEQKHKGWFGSKESHSKPSTVVSPKVEPSTHLHPPALPPSHHPLVPPVDSPSLVSPLHHTNPFYHSQSSPPPISPCNPFFSLLQHNPFYEDMLTAKPLKPSPPPLPYLSSSRPPIAHLFPQTSRPNLTRNSPTTTEYSGTGTDATSEGKARVEKRPLPPIPTEKEAPLNEGASQPCMSAGGPQPDSEWDDCFEAFAAGRLQPPEDQTTGYKTQRSTTSDSPQEHCSNRGASLPLTDDARHPQTCTKFGFEAHKAAIPVTNSNTSHYDAFAHFLETIPEHISSESENVTLHTPTNSQKLPACTETNQANSFAITNYVTDTNGDQVPHHASSVKLHSGSPDPGSSGLGSSVEEDFLSCLSSYSDKFSASSSEEAEAQSSEGDVLSFEKSSESVKSFKPSEAEDDVADGSTYLSLVDTEQHRDGDEKVEINVLDGSSATHQQPVGETPASKRPVLQPQPSSSSQYDRENEEKRTEEGDLSGPPQDFSEEFHDPSVCENNSADDVIASAPDEGPAAPIITSSPEVRQRTSPGGHNASQHHPLAFGLLEDFLHGSHIVSSPSRGFDDTLSLTQSTSSFLQSFYLSADSQDYRTCASHPSSESCGGSGPSDTLHSANSTLCAELSDVQMTAGAASGERFTDARRPSDEEINPAEKSEAADNSANAPQISTVGGAFGLEALPAASSCNPRKLSEEGVESQPAVSKRPQAPTLHRSQSEGTLMPICNELLLPAFGSDPGAIQEESSSADLPSLTSFAPPLTPDSSSSPVVLCSLPPFANATAGSSQSTARAAAPKPMPQESRQQRAANQQNSPHLVKPLTTTMLTEEKRTEGRSVLATGLEKLKSTINPGRGAQLSEPETDRKKAVTGGAGSYYHLNHNELVALLVQREAELERQKEEFEQQKFLLAKREVELKKLKPQIRDLEDYIDTLLVRIMEQKPTLLQVRSKLK